MPDAGALLDQDYQQIRQMEVCANVYDAVSRLRNSRGAQIHSLTESERKILGWLVKERMLFSG
jgi:hypothetical protein